MTGPSEQRRAGRAAARVTRAGSLFDEWADAGRAEGMERAHAPIARRVFEALPLPPDGRYLDVGCGNGYTVRWAAERMPAGRAVGLDVSSQMIARAQSLSADYSNAEFIESPFPAPGLSDGSFDVIFSMEVFYYFPDIDAALEAVAKLLKPGGTFACVVDYYGENEASHGWPEHVGVAMTLLSRSAWRRAFERAGFVRVRQEQLTEPVSEATEQWRATVGSLVTVGERGR
jgi:SAM-dependent methyltransferase